MKIKHLALACAAAVSSQAFALAPTATVDIASYMSGSSAQLNTLGAILTSNCVAGTLDTYKSITASGTGKDWVTYSCQLNGSQGNANLNNKKIKVMYRAKGGSVYGVTPIARKFNVEFMDPANGGCTGATPNYTCDLTATASRSSAVLFATTDECPQTNANLSASDKTTVCRIPDGGVADVEPAMFQYTQNSAPSVAPLTGAEKATLVSGSEFGVTFAVVVSKDIADALRAAGKQTASGMASMTKSEVTSIFSGGVVAWQQVYADASFASASGLRVCRRETGSGTQATMQAFFNNFPCTSSATAFVTAANSDSSIPYTVIENDTGGKMVNCAADAAGGSIGFVGIDQSGIPANVEKVAIDGVEPTFANAQTGKYQLFVENSINYRNTITSETNGTAKKALFDRIKAEGSSAATLYTVFGASSSKNAGALTGNGNAYPAANANEATVTFRGTRGGSSCAPITLAPENF